MTDPVAIDICRTPEGGAQTNTVNVCLWCECRLKDLLKDKQFKTGATSDDVKKLHEHLKRFGMTIELSEWKEKDRKFEDGADLGKHAWGAATNRALRMFAAHAQVGKESARIIKSDGKAVTSDLVTKIQEWCRGKVASPKNYWEYKGLVIRVGDMDAVGAHATPEKQTVLHDYIVQIETDLCKIGFGVHTDSVCNLGAQHKATGIFESAKANGAGKHEDKSLNDVSYLVRKFQRQAQWLWRMKADGTHLADAKSSDDSVYAGSCTGDVDAATAKALHAWETSSLHMVINKFELKGLTWPPETSTPITNDPGSSQAKLRKDAYAAWLKAAKEISKLGGTVAGPYASSPRGWSGGKPASSSASAWSFHYCGLAVDLAQALLSSDGTISDARPYGIEKDGETFTLWCWISPQPAKPADPADDKKDATRQYRNRNIKYKHDKDAPNEKVKASDAADTSPLYFATTKRKAKGDDVVDVAAREGWYVNVSAIMKASGLDRIPRHKNWDKDPKAWEWWHYQFPAPKPAGSSTDLNFGECLQLFGVHEYRLRQLANGWSTHEDIEHKPG